MIQINEDIAIDETELEFDFVRASGPGGQNVNKVSTAVQLRFPVRQSPSLPDDIRLRLLKIAANRITRDGWLIIEAKRYRSQERNRQDAVNRLVELVRKAATKPRKRKKTAPSKASRERRLQEKRKRGEAKTRRRPVSDSDD